MTQQEDVRDKRLLFKAEGFVKALPGGQLTLGSFEVFEGDRVALLGTSGRGKTTLMQHLAGLTRITEADQGNLWYFPAGTTGTPVPTDGFDLRRRSSELARLRRDEFGFVFQKPELLEFLNISENIHLRPHLRGIVNSPGDEARLAKEALDLLEVEHLPRDNPADLSGGEASRVAFLRSVQGSPSVLFVDEPASDLDSEAKWFIASLVARWADRGRGRRTVFLVTHDIPMAWQFATKFLILPKDRSRPVVVASRDDLGALPVEEGTNQHVTWKRLHEIVGYSCADAEQWVQPVEDATQRRFEERQERLLEILAPSAASPSLSGHLRTFFRLVWRDFWRRGRASSRWTLTWGAPILLVAIHILMFAALFAISGVRTRTIAHFEEALRNPLNWVETVEYVDNLPESGVPPFPEADDALLERLPKMAEILGRENFRDMEILKRSVRLADPDSGRYLGHQQLVFLHPANPAFQAFVAQVETSDEQRQVLLDRPDWEGVILSRSLAEQIAGNGDVSGIVGRWIAAVRLGPGDRDVLLPMRVLGVAPAIPGGDALVSIGMGYSFEDLVLRFQARKFQVRLPRPAWWTQPETLQPPERPAFWKKQEELVKTWAEWLEGQLRPEIVKSLVPRGIAGVLTPEEDGSSGLGFEARIVPTPGDENPVLEVDLGVPVYLPVIRKGLDAACRAAASPGCPVDLVFPGVAGLYTERPSSMDGHFWLRALPLSDLDTDLAIAHIDETVSQLKQKGFAIDSSLRERIRHLTRMRTIFEWFGDIAFFGASVIFLIAILVFLVFDSFRKTHAIAILMAQGISRLSYFGVLVVQTFMVALGALALALPATWLLGAALFSELDGLLGGSGGMLKVSEIQWLWVLGAWGVVWLSSVAIRTWIFCRAEPGEQLRY